MASTLVRGWRRAHGFRLEHHGHAIPALSFSPPWPFIVFHRNKRDENRTWAPPHGYSGWVWIHQAALAVKAEWEKAFALADQVDPGGPSLPWAIACPLTVKSVKSYIPSAFLGIAYVNGFTRTPHDLPSEGYRYSGHYHWKLSQVAEFNAPMFAPGAQQLWLPTPSEQRSLFELLYTSHPAWYEETRVSMPGAPIL